VSESFIEEYLSDADKAKVIYARIAHDAQAQAAEREKIQPDLQTNLFEIMQDVTLNKLRVADKAFQGMDKYIRDEGGIDIPPVGGGKLISEVSIEESSMKFGKPPDQTSKTFDFDVFLCYSSADKLLVLKIAEELRRNSITYWLDLEQIKFGDRITKMIEQGLEKSHYIVPCISANLARSNWTFAEFGAMLNAELSGDTNRIVVIPLKLDDCSDSEIPLLLRDKKRVVYTNRVEFAEFVRFLLLR
jgi:hypothetical protein